MTNEFVDLPPSMRIAKVTLVDVDVPFTSMVVFMVKWALASIPALAILFGLFVVLGFLFGRAVDVLTSLL